jgi:hypothetical protein
MVSVPDDDAPLRAQRRAPEGPGRRCDRPEADITTRRIGSLTNATHRTSFRDGRASNELSVQVGTFTWDFPPTASDLQTPRVEIRSPDGTTQAVVGSSNFIFDESELQLQIKELFEARLSDRHTLRAGFDVVRSSFELLGANTNPLGAYVVIDEGNITPAGRFLSITDVPADVRVFSYTIDANPQQVDLTQTLWSAFIEDRWRVSPSLTLQAGCGGTTTTSRRAARAVRTWTTSSPGRRSTGSRRPRAWCGAVGGCIRASSPMRSTPTPSSSERRATPW